MAINKPFEFFIQWHVTENCNLGCRHCYQGERGTGQMSFSDIKRVTDEASDMIKEWSEAYGISFVPSMSITGGEPFLREDLLPILSTVKDAGFNVSVLTNGTLINSEQASRLAAIGVDSVQVSLEGPEDVHDAIRGKGSFAASAAGLEHLVDCGLDVTLNVTLSALNAAYLDRLIAFGSRAGVRRIGFSRLVPTGKGRALISKMLSKDELKKIYSSVLFHELFCLDIVTGDPVAAILRNGAPRDAGEVAIGGCAAGVSGLTIMPNGNLLPCRRLPISLGNVMRDSLREIWAVSPVLEALRDRTRYAGACGKCAQWAHCRGCRAIAYAWSRSQGGDDFLADDPQCFFQS